MSADETSAEQRRYVQDGLTPIECRGCDTAVLVRKNSAKHTSVQWSTPAAVTCPQIAAEVAAGMHSARVLGCPLLRRSIDAAVADGTLTVSHA
jgi:hypothetical protein